MASFLSTWFTTGSVPPLQGCEYPSDQYANVTLFHCKLFAILLHTSFSLILFQHTKLHRLYSTLAWLVDTVIVGSILNSLAYFSLYPYPSGHRENCTDIYLSRIVVIVMLLVELHQVYFLAHVLGSSNKRFQLWRMGWSFSLDSLLNLVSISIVTSTLLALFVRRILLLRGIWTIVAAFMQIKLIDMYQRVPENDRISMLPTNAENSLFILQKLARLQIICCLFNLVPRLLRLFSIVTVVALGPTLSMIDEVVIAYCYIKILLVAENANVSVIIVKEESED